MHNPNYIPVESTQSPWPAVAAGNTGVPEVITAGGIVSAPAKILFSTNFATGDTITFGGVTLTAVAANPTSLQFVPQSTLALTLAELETQFQGLSTPVAGTYSVTDTGTSLTFTPTGYGYTSAGLWTYTTPVTASNVKTSGGTATVVTGQSGVTQTFSTNFATGDSISFAGVTLTAIASSLVGGNPAAPNAGQFVPGTTLSQTLEALTLAFQAQVPYTTATFVTDGATFITANSPVKTAAAAYTVSANKASGGTNTPTQSTNLCSPVSNVSLDTEHTQIAGAGSFDVYLPDGTESQKKSITMFGTGTVNVKGAHLPSTYVNFAMNGSDALVLQFLGGKWRLILNDGAVAS